MPKFTTNSQPAAAPINASIKIDNDGDVVLQLDGITIAFIDSRDGKLYPMIVSDDYEAALAAKGITFDASHRIAGRAQ